MKAHLTREAGERPARPADARLEPRQFAVLFEQSWRTLWCIAAAVLGRRDEVDDVLQESALIAMNKLDEFDPETSFAAWMGQIVRYTALNTGRRRARRQAITPGSDRLVEQSESQEKNYSAGSKDVTSDGHVAADQSSFDDRLLNALSRLGETQRACLLLRVVQELSYKDIALALSIPEGTAMSHVHRAQKALRETLFGEAAVENKNMGAGGAGATTS